MAKPDVLIIGGGPAGYVAAIRLAQFGKKTALVERGRVGGVCLNRGCIPVKALLHSAAVVRNAAEARRMGINFPEPEVDIVALYSYKSRIVDRLVRGTEFLLKANGVELIRGEAKFSGPNRVAVTSDGADERVMEPGTIVIATGSRPTTLAGVEADGRKVIDSDGALDLVELPKRLVVVGAGVIGLEFATIFSRLGCKVMVLELLDQVLPGVDRELASAIEKSMRREGVEIRLKVRVEEVVREDPVRVRFTGGEDEETVKADRVLVAVGREPLCSEIGLERAGVKLNGQGFVAVDSSYRTSAERIYAIGDVKGGPLLAHKAMAEAIALAEQLAGGKGWKFKAVPSCVYTDPEVAVVGMSEEEAKKQGRNVKVGRVPLNAVGRSLTLGRSEGLCKMVVDEKTDKVLGVGIVAPQADVLIAEAAMAVELGLTADKVGRVVHPHPTMSELLFEAAGAIHGRAIHVVNR